MNDLPSRYRACVSGHGVGTTTTPRGDVELVAVTRFDGSEPLARLLSTRGIRVKVFDTLPAAIRESRTLRGVVLVARLPLESGDDGAPITLVVRNVGAVDRYEERFDERFAEFFSGSVDPVTLCSAVVRHAALASHTPPRRPGRVA